MTPRLITPSSPHRHGEASVRKVMLDVLYALVPGVAAYVWFFGWGVVVNIALASVVALASEWLMLVVRGRPVRQFLGDGSAVVTAALLAVALPAVAPWWVTAVGAAFAIVVAKHLYGGLGYNPFNPAMIGYVLLLVSFPKYMTVWPAADVVCGHPVGFLDSVGMIFSGTPESAPFDALTGATPLDYLKVKLGAGVSVGDASTSPVFGALAGRGWEWGSIGFLLGGLWLIYRRVITWHIPVTMMATLFAIALVFHLMDPARYASPLFHLFAGGAMLGAFFIATDPVTASTTPLGRIVYAAGIGVLEYVIRVWGGYPDALAFSVLLMNIVVPTIDHYTQPRVFGHGRA